MLPVSTPRTAHSLTFIVAGICLCLCLWANPAFGQAAQYWDNNGVSVATSGTWDTTTKIWAPSGTLIASTVAFTNNNYAIFAGGSAAISALTITVPGAVTCEGLGDGETSGGGGTGASVTNLTFSGAGSINLPSGMWPLECGNGGGPPTVTINVPITGPGGFIQHNDGALVLAGTNTYSGGTEVTGGQVIYYYNSASFGTGPITVAGGSDGSAIVNNTLPEVALTIPNNFVFSGSEVANLAGGNPVAGAPGTTFTGTFPLPSSDFVNLETSSTATEVTEIAGVISGAGGLIVSDDGTLELAATNTYTGSTTVSSPVTLAIIGSGSLNSGSYSGVITNNSALIYNSSANQTLSGVLSGTGRLAQNGSGTLTISGADTFTGGASIGASSTLIIGGAGTITAAGKITNNGTFTYNSSGSETISGIISGTGALNLTGTGGLTLGGANTYSGINTVNNGLLAISSDGNLGAVPGSAVANSITLNSGTTGANNGLRIAATTLTLSATRGITLGSSGAAIQVAAGDTVTYNGIITGSGNLYMGPNFNTGSGTLILGGANTYSGSTTVACGILQLGASGALPSGTPMVIASSSNGGILNVNGLSQTIGTLSSSPGISGTGTTIPTIELGTSGALTINEAGSSTFAGAITGGSSGGGVTLNSGSYALTLSGTSSYSSPTMINSGELLGATGGGIASSTVTVSSGATNGVSITTNTATWTTGPLTFNSGATVLDFNFGYSVPPSTSVAPLTVNGAVAFNGTTIVTVEGGNFPDGAGTYPLMTWTSISGTPPSTVILPPHVVGTLSVSGTTLYLNVTASTQPLRWTGAAGNGLWDIATSQNWDDNTGTPVDYLQTTIPGDAVIFDETYITAPTAITLNTTVTPASVTVSNTIYNYSISGTGGIAGASGLTQLGSGSLMLACANTYTGPTTNLGGILIVGADANLGAAPGSATASSIVLSNATLSATNTFTLNANRGITMLTNSTLDVAAGAQVTYTGIIAGPANLTKTSPGTLVLGGNNNSYSGNTIIAAGILQIGGDHTNSIPSNFGVPPSTYAPTNITLAGGTLQGNNADFSFSTNRGIVLLANSGLSALNGDIMGIPGGISGSFGLTISNLGTGIVFLTGTNTYTGSTLVSTGLVSLQAGGSISNSSLNIAAAAGFDVSRLSITSYPMGGTTFTASGHGAVTNIGSATAAVINGAAGGTVNLVSLPIFLTFTPSAFAGDSTHPSLYVTQGTLKLNGNSFTVNNASATALGAGTYELIRQNGGTITSSGSYTVSVTGNGIVTGNAASISVSGTNVNLVVTWQPPTIANPALTTNAPVGLLWKIAITNLASAAGWGDPEGDPVTLSSAGPTSTNGASVTSDGNYIYYNSAVTVADQFAYTITDGTKTTVGNVNLVPVSSTGPSIASPTTTPAGNPTFSGFGIPGYTYGVESTANLVSGPWIEAGNAPAAGDGSYSFTDLNQTNPPVIFYRLYYPDDPSNPPQ